MEEIMSKIGGKMIKACERFENYPESNGSIFWRRETGRDIIRFFTSIQQKNFLKA